ncbi:MAG: orotidine-5'-phosphate decarboxylase [Candidatus Aminicenantes bacterium]|nr:orotidine-5'-phosphate decarboxylase [Candidatus Aminicenantes bacterium]
MENKERLKEKIIVALDVGTKERALALAGELEDARIFKIGMELFTAEGPKLIEAAAAMGKKAFLDLKYHDIPNTVGGAVRSAARLGIHMLTLHASGGKEMMTAAAGAAREESARTGRLKPILLGVTVLTSLKDDDLREIGCSRSTAEQVLKLAKLARSAGLDGVVCSPHEIEIIKKECGPDFLVVTPGIRPAGSASQDQKRIMTPAEALIKGADYMVIGRSITGAPSPHQAFLRIVSELENA